MAGKRARQIHTMKRGEVRNITIDWGENTAQQKTGVLAAGATVSSCTAAILLDAAGTQQKPTGSTAPVLGSITMPANTLSDDIEGRVWSTGEVTTCTCTATSDQVLGEYVFEFTAVTSNSETIDVEIVVRVIP